MRTLLVSFNTEQINMPVLPVGLAAVAAASRAGHERGAAKPDGDEDASVAASVEAAPASGV